METVEPKYPNKTEIRLEIDKTIQPQQFEPIKIIVDVTESFYWKDEEERKKKMKVLTVRMTEDFVKTFNGVAMTIGEHSRCIGRVVTSGDVPSESVPVDDDEFSFD